MIKATVATTWTERPRWPFMPRVIPISFSFHLHPALRILGIDPGLNITGYGVLESGGAGRGCARRG